MPALMIQRCTTQIRLTGVLARLMAGWTIAALILAGGVAAARADSTAAVAASAVGAAVSVQVVQKQSLTPSLSAYGQVIFDPTHT
ncbi:MAG: hypothetical protein B7Y58_02425, partial [Halothiobacillus sp. 35-54-62]